MRSALPLLVVAIVAATSSARAQGRKRECARTSEAGQKDRDEGRMRDARHRFLACARDECPDVVRRDCVAWAAELEPIIPTVVFVVHDAHGEDARGARVLVDGEPAEAIGRAIMIDPGHHDVRAELPDGASASKGIEVAEAVKNRVVILDVDAPPPAREKPPAPPEPAASPPVLGYVLGAVGLALAGATAYFWIDGKAREDELRSTCSPNCARDDVDGLRTRYRVSYVTAGASVIALGAGVYFLFFAPTARARASVTWSGAIRF